MASLDQVADGIYRIATFAPRGNATFNQFLIEDEHPTLVHAGTRQDYEAVKRAIASVLEPSRLEYVVVLQFEGDEFGAMDQFATDAAGAVVVCGPVAARAFLHQLGYAGAIREVQDGDMLDLGSHKLRFLETPHVHAWDSIMAFEESTRSLFSGDLFVQPGDQPAIVREDLSREMCQWLRDLGVFAAEGPVRRVLDRLEGLAPSIVHPMHGGSLTADVLPVYVRALRTEPLAFNGKLFGRTVPS